jgi:hypothetical protein
MKKRTRAQKLKKLTTFPNLKMATLFLDDPLVLNQFSDLALGHISESSD